MTCCLKGSEWEIQLSFPQVFSGLGRVRLILEFPGRWKKALT